MSEHENDKIWFLQNQFPGFWFSELGHLSTFKGRTLLITWMPGPGLKCGLTESINPGLGLGHQWWTITDRRSGHPLFIGFGMKKARMAVKFEAGLIVLSIFVSFSLASYIRNRRNYDFCIFPKIFVTQLFCWFVDVTESLGLNRPNYRSVDPWAKYNWTYLIIVYNRPIVGVMIFSSGLIFVC